MSVSFSMGTVKSSGNGEWWRLHNTVNVISDTELCTSRVKMVNFILHIPWDNKKSYILKKING